MRIRSASWLAALAAVFALAAFAAPARADLLITVDKASQRMTVAKDGEPLFVWPVSTGIAKYDTPNGSYMPFRMEKEHFSKEWDDAPMPHSIFFTKRGHAIHGTTHKNIGRPASHGCVRLEPKNAALLFDLVQQETIYKTRVVITGEADFAPQVAGGRTRGEPSRRNTVPRAAPGFEQSFSTDDVTASVPTEEPSPRYAQPRYAPPADIPPAYERRRGQRAVIGYRDTRTGQIYYYDRPRYEPAPRYVQPRRYGYEVPPPGYYYYER